MHEVYHAVVLYLINPAENTHVSYKSFSYTGDILMLMQWVFINLNNAWKNGLSEWWSLNSINQSINQSIMHGFSFNNII